MFQHAHKFDECLLDGSMDNLCQKKTGAEKLAEIFNSAPFSYINGIEHGLRKTAKNQAGRSFCQPWYFKFAF